MKAVVYQGPHKVAVHDVPDPRIGFDFAKRTGGYTKITVHPAA
ncbi:MAG: hypothetical protein JO132_11380 [Streptosporangiaceae bacterium]|nr:hypothetical protein [Streptosporangiaceae bacterium]